MRLLPIRAMINSEKLHRRWMFHERGYESDPCCCCDIRDPFGYEKTRYRRADSTDNDYDHAALFSRSSLFFSLFLCGFTSGQHRDSRYLRRIHISDIFIDARPKKRSKRVLDGALGPEIGSSVSWIASPFERRWATR